MARVFITGSADGLGQLSASLLIKQGHEVVLHARNAERAHEAKRKTPGAKAVLIADLRNLEETIQLAKEANDSGPFDAVIHNAGVYQASSKATFAVNTIAPYVLTALIQKPKRLIYLSSGMHLHGSPHIDYIQRRDERINYSDTKVHVLMIALAAARRWPSVFSNAVDPGWVPTRMGGKGAPDDLQKGYETQSWLAVSNDEKAKVSGHYFFHQKIRPHNAAADDVPMQEKLLDVLGELTGVSFP